MPKTTKKNAVAPKVLSTKLNLQFRQILADAYSFVQGERFTASVSSVNLETLMAEQIEQIEGTDGKTSIRLNKKDEVTRLINQTTKAVAAVKKMDPTAFTVKGGDKKKPNVNTPLSNGNGST